MVVREVRRQIVAMGGGGFSMEPENPLLDRYLLSLTSHERPAVCFLPTASGDAEGYISGFYAAFQQLPCVPTHIGLFRTTRGDLRSLLLAQQIIYVGGGNTRNMLVLWKEWGLDQVLREAWESGIVLAGLSAGMICWFESGVTDSIPGTSGEAIDDLSALSCLGFLPGSSCPHYDGEAHRRPAYHRMVTNGYLAGGYAADDGAALHFDGNELMNVVTSRPEAHAYRVELHDGRAVESIIPSTYLG